jgi:hypothetical protein
VLKMPSLSAGGRVGGRAGDIFRSWMLPNEDDDLQGDEFPAFPAELGPEPVFSLAQFLNIGRVNEGHHYKGRCPLLLYFVFVL